MGRDGEGGRRKMEREQGGGEERGDRRGGEKDEKFGRNKEERGGERRKRRGKRKGVNRRKGGMGGVAEVENVPEKEEESMRETRGAGEETRCGSREGERERGGGRAVRRDRRRRESDKEEKEGCKRRYRERVVTDGGIEEQRAEEKIGDRGQKEEGECGHQI
ncbi:hypothetical protein Tco_0937063 [Tanacetum coccineum]|uniref:Uncharacterized protein n=1 Tax=Tanacetum coccineum TaxID=301880 RepID=A0ABQ4ZY59_9ASTR